MCTHVELPQAHRCPLFSHPGALRVWRFSVVKRWLRKTCSTLVAGHMAVSADKGCVPNVVEQLEGCGQAGSLKRQQPELRTENTTTPKAPKRQKSIPSAEQHDDQNQTPNQDGCQQLQQAVQSVCDEEELPSWCEHPLVLRQHFADDAQVRARQAVCLLPSVFQHIKHALLCNSSHSMWRHVWPSRTLLGPCMNLSGGCFLLSARTSSLRAGGRGQSRTAEQSAGAGWRPRCSR